MNIELPLDRKQRERLRPFSKAFFHSEYAFEAYLLIAQSKRFYKGQIATVTGCQPSYASSFLQRLEREQLVEPVPSEEGQRRHYLRKAPSPAWDALLGLARALLYEEAQGDAQVTSLPQRPLSG
jgi:DNA-binding MarR family transcriptional regulator